MHPIVSAKWLHENMDMQDLVLLDTSLPGTAEGKTSDLGSKTIPGARFFDLKKKFSDLEAPFPNTMPSPTEFETACRELGISNHHTIVVFDKMGIYSSPRVWWMFKAMGHDQVFVLDGGLPAWIKQEYPLETIAANAYAAGTFKAKYHPQYLKTYEDVVQNVDTQGFTIVDARSEGRFSGTAPDPRKHLKSGHIPQSINLPYGEVLENGKFKSPETLKALFQKQIGAEKELVFSCGSGLTACIILMAGHLAGRKDMMVYDGSWTEWAELQGLTIT